MPHVPLKVLRGEQEQEDVRDQHYERFKAPGTTTEDTEDDKYTDDDSRTSNDDMATIGEADEEGEEGMARYLGGRASSVDSVIQFDNEIQNDQNQNTQENPEYDTTGSVNHESDEVRTAAQVNHLPDSDVTSNDDAAPLLTNMHRWYMVRMLTTSQLRNVVGNCIALSCN